MNDCKGHAGICERPSYRRPTLLFGEFLASLLRALAAEGVRFCILRNYEGFPARNLGNDIDFLILPSDLPLAIRALRSIQGIRIVGYTERPSVAITFVEGVSPAPGKRALQVDFIMSLHWKGLPFLATDAVLRDAVPRQAGNLVFFVPSPIHEAITSLLSSLLVGGWLKEKYFPQVQRTFAEDGSAVIAALSPYFGSRASTRLVESSISGDRRKILDCVWPLRASLAWRSLRHGPVRCLAAIARHYASEIVVRFSPKNVEAACILGPDGCGKTTIVESLMPLLESSAQQVKRRHLRPRLLFGRESAGVTVVTDPHAKAARGSFLSLAKLVLWLAEEWLSQFVGKRNLTLRICDRYYHDLLIDPIRYRYGGPMWCARLVGKLFPSPDLWILLDAPAEVLQSRKQEVSPAETARQRDAYLSFVKTRTNYIILDASEPVGNVTEGAYSAIIDTLVRRYSRLNIS